VLNGTHRLIGLVERDVLIVLLQKKCWYKGNMIKVFTRNVAPISTLPKEFFEMGKQKAYTVDLRPFELD
jgi:hypothetical protein